MAIDGWKKISDEDLHLLAREASQDNLRHAAKKEILKRASVRWGGNPLILLQVIEGETPKGIIKFRGMKKFAEKTLNDHLNQELAWFGMGEGDFKRSTSMLVFYASYSKNPLEKREAAGLHFVRKMTEKTAVDALKKGKMPEKTLQQIRHALVDNEPFEKIFQYLKLFSRDWATKKVLLEHICTVANYNPEVHAKFLSKLGGQPGIIRRLKAVLEPMGNAWVEKCGGKTSEINLSHLEMLLDMVGKENGIWPQSVLLKARQMIDNVFIGKINGFVEEAELWHPQFLLSVCQHPGLTPQQKDHAQKKFDELMERMIKKAVEDGGNRILLEWKNMEGMPIKHQNIIGAHLKIAAEKVVNEKIGFFPQKANNSRDVQAGQVRLPQKVLKT